MTRTRAPSAAPPVGIPRTADPPRGEIRQQHRCVDVVVHHCVYRSRRIPSGTGCALSKLPPKQCRRGEGGKEPGGKAGAATAAATPLVQSEDHEAIVLGGHPDVAG